MELRVNENLLSLNPFNEGLAKELASGKFALLPNRDQSGAAIAVFSAKRHNPSESSTSSVLQAVVFQLDFALSNPEIQRNGLTCIYDMSGSSLNNFELTLSKKLLGILRDGYPARLKAVYVVTPPLWFKTMYKILTPFLKDKIRDRVTLVNAERLCRYVPATSLPKELGGTKNFSHMDWIKGCVDQATDSNRNSETLSNEFSNDSRALEANRRAVELFAAGAHLTSSPSQENHLDQRTNSSGSLQDTVPEPRGSSESLNTVGISNGGKHEAESAEAVKINGMSSSSELDFDERQEAAQQPSIVMGNGDTLLGEARTLTTDDHLSRSDADGLSSDEPEDPPPKPPRPSVTDSDISENIPAEEEYDGECVHQPDGHGLDMRSLVEYVLTQKQSGMYQEYAAIRAEPPTGTFNASRHKFNLPKNRYADVVCYDHSRVCLPPINGDPFSDYINANYVDGYKHKNAFIAAQGPLPKTYSDFWRLIWSEHVLTVVMTTKCMERNRQKCGQYWPAEKETTKDYGIFRVSNLEAIREKDYTITSLLLKNTMTDEIRQVTHMQFTSWPDFGTPNSASAMLHFRKEVRWYQSQALETMDVAWTGHPGGPPILIHCSAGIGRTGTFCTLDISMCRLEDIGTVDICNTVRKMRSQRAFSIQTPDQYEFCYLALIEYAQTKGMLVGLDLDFNGYEDIESDG
ncbi:putative tyrosine-protein phosphatase non-receptor type 9 isoform X1 [Apostichopus japonicus]|uniref:Putative tyrosine-protein phosphatase non-receptor type 9 isoform X1 n=1 Tax=Stichopus japonicus TaxID=307972 RepID=A0A2G8KTP7_STIJA|nr:putative tyrosine-protein phosphatase non-receptor type 9 isoform X1 [Apostichopus japonicus]